MALYKRGKQWHMLAVVNGVYYRQSLKTTDYREAVKLERQKIKLLEEKTPDLHARGKSYGSMTVGAAIDAYSAERKAQVSPRMFAFWKEQKPALAAFFRTTKLRGITPAHIAEYQNERLDKGRAPKTINNEVATLRQVMKHARLWYRFKEDYKPIRNTKPPVGLALTEEEQARLFEAAQSRSDWLYAHAASTLAFYCGMRACEIKALRWQDINFTANTIEITRSKTLAGHRKPSLNEVCRQALANLNAKATLASAANSEHYVFPSHKGGRKIDATRPITSWRSAWRSLRHKAARNDEGEVIYPAIERVRFHDGRHTAITTLCEKGVPDWVIQAQVGHVAPEMMKTYSHIRRQALDLAGAALQPNFPVTTSASAEMIN